ncbi:MAG: DnaD domain protein [Clostridia bacterium]|nr:DnaD domain protein [Clostridia bacterium]
MAFISLSPELSGRSFTGVENKFITKYMPVLDALSVKVYLYGLYLCSNGQNLYTITDLATALSITEDQAVSCYEYLEEFELVKITSLSPFEVTYCEAENVRGTPKKYKPEKYGDFAKSVQSIIKGRMISTSEYQEYFYLLEEYGFEQSALLMIINYCISLKGDNIRSQYIKKVAQSFAAEGAVTARQVDEKLSAYTSSTPALIRIFAAAGIKRSPDIEDDKLYKKWNGEMGFSEEAIIAASKYFKTKNVAKLDDALTELYKNKKFDVKEIEFYCKNKNSVYNATIEIARSLGVYMQNSAPYIETYVNVWCDWGYDFDSLKKLAAYCFTHGNNSFEGMNGFLQGLYNEGIITEQAINSYIAQRNADDELIKNILSACGLSRKIINWDRECLARWKGWNFTDEMLLKAAELAQGKSNPVAYMNGILSSWKNEGIYTPDKIENVHTTAAARSDGPDRATIERHYAELRQLAESNAEAALNGALADSEYGELNKTIDKLNIQLIFAESKGDGNTEEIRNQLAETQKKADSRLAVLGINKQSFTPQYSCAICGDTGYDANGRQCRCLKKFIDEYKGI